jgi:hypothetical protein
LRADSSTKSRDQVGCADHLITELIEIAQRTDGLKHLFQLGAGHVRATDQGQLPVTAFDKDNVVCIVTEHDPRTSGVVRNYSQTWR